MRLIRAHFTTWTLVGLAKLHSELAGHVHNNTEIHYHVITWRMLTTYYRLALTLSIHYGCFWLLSLSCMWLNILPLVYLAQRSKENTFLKLAIYYMFPWVWMMVFQRTFEKSASKRYFVVFMNCMRWNNQNPFFNLGMQIFTYYYT